MAQIETFTGKTVGGFQILRLLGRSQLGAAYLAQHPTQGHMVMITIFYAPEGQAAQEREHLTLRVTREGEALTRLSHSQILPVYACGIQAGLAYLITAFAKEASLAQLLKQNQRFSPQQVLPWLKQIAAALDFAHSQGVVHGMLSLSNVLVNDDLNVRIAGFGLRVLLDMYGNTDQARPLEHLSSIHGAFLGNPDSISPERVLGLAIDPRADIYALGTMLFALLSGSPPFRGEQHLDSILQRVQQPAPLLYATCPDLPEAFDMVLGKMLERDPAKRTPSAGEAAAAFERVVKAMRAASTATTGAGPVGARAQNPQITIPPTVNWFDEAMIPSDPQSTGSPAHAAVLATGTAPTVPTASPEASFSHTGSLAPTTSGPVSLEGTDPFLWWSSASTGFQSPGGAPGTFPRNPSQRLHTPGVRRRPRPGVQGRRKVVKMIAVGTVASAVTLGGISLARMAQGLKQPSQLATTTQSGAATTSGTTTTAPGTSTAGTTPGATGTSGATGSPTSQPTTGPGTQPSPPGQPKPTQPPPPTPTPGHTGTVIGHTNQANNSAVAFTNPANGQASLLIRMANGNFIACESACTHAGVACNYSAGQHLVTCPAHGATFDPANGFAPTSPAPTPLPRVNIRVNGDGTITAG